MSKKKSKGETDEQQIRAQIRRQIRKDMRSMFATQNDIETQKIISKHLQSHPGEEDFIKNVVNDYAKAIKEIAAKGNANWGKSGGASTQKQQQQQQPNTIDMAGPAKPEEPRLAVKVQVPSQSKSDEGSQYSDDSNAQFLEQLMSDSQPPKLPSSNPPNSKKKAKAEKAEAKKAEAKKAKAEAKKAKVEAKEAKAHVQETKVESKKPNVESRKPNIESNREEEQLNLVNKTNALLETFKEDLASQRMTSSPDPGASLNREKTPDLEAQLQFLSLDGQNTIGGSGSSFRSIEQAVLISPTLEEMGEKMPPQFGLLGHLATKQSEDLVDPRVMLNTNIPFSAFVCGLQGSGKSHTTSCMIENCSLPFQALGTLKKPLSTLVLHYNEYSSNVSSQPSEAAFLASIMPEYKKNYKKSIPVRVLTSPSNFHNLEKMYSQIPNVTVRPFLLQPQHLNIATMLSLMSMGKKDSMPLYMAQLTRILREMALTNKGYFNYFDFRKRVKDLRLDRSQTPFLEQRLDLLDSFLDLKGEGRNKGSDYFVDGGVTILDLSCPFMDQSTACILFRIAIDLFLHAHPSRGKMIVADEAHKYMNNTEAANALTETFMNIIRQQRHLGVRVIISTQEPTISPRLIDLCSITVVHRFSSPEWYQTIKKHISIDDKRAANGDDDNMDGLYHISSLRTGEALVFAPSSYLLDERQEMIDVKHRSFKMVIRKRITWDGGQSITSVR